MSRKIRGQRHPGHASNAEMRDRPAEKPARARLKVSKEELSRLI
jgi:hypothetical protein